MAALTLESRIQDLVRRDRRYQAEAYLFVFEALDHVSQRSWRRALDARHVSVQQLLDGIRALAMQEFGPLARCVFESWGVYRTEDFGEIVFNLIHNNLLNQSEDDDKKGFQDGFSFRETFEQAYRPSLKIEP